MGTSGYANYLNYLNQRNPATGLMWTQDQIARQTGANPADLQKYLDVAQQSNLNSVYGTAAAPNYATALSNPAQAAAKTAQAVNESARPATVVPTVRTQGLMNQQPFDRFNEPFADRGLVPTIGNRGVTGDPAEVMNGPRDTRPQLPVAPAAASQPLITGQPWLNPYGGRPMESQPGMEMLRIFSTLAGPYTQNAMNQGQNVMGSLWNFLQDPSYSPQGLMNQAMYQPGSPFQNLQNAPGNTQWLQMMQNLAPFWQNQTANLNQMSQSGMGNQNTAQNLIGGQGNYGLSDLYSQIMQQGLPNQRAIEQIVPGALQQGNQMNSTVNPILQQILTQGLPGQRGIESLMGQAGQEYQTGALNPQFIQAMREQVLQPTQEATQGALNRQFGGQALIPAINEGGQMTNAGQSSGLASELMRRNERDFMNNLVAQGMANKQVAGGLANTAFGNIAGAASPYFQMAQRGGEQGINNALAAFGIVPQSVSPFTAQAGNLASNLQNQGLSQMMGAQNMAMQPYQMYSNAQNNLLNTLMDAYGQNLRAQQNLGQMYNQGSLGGLGAFGATVPSLVSQDYNWQLQNLVRQQLGDEAWGKIIAMMATAAMGGGG